MEPDRIYFDMDGVLADFDKGIADHTNVGYCEQGKHSKESEDKMWDGVRSVSHFYGRLEPVPDGIALFNELNKLYPRKCEILTSVPKPFRRIFGVEDDKREWIRKNLGEDIKCNVVYGAKRKLEYLYNNDCVLIDDYKANTDRWQKAGGVAILFDNFKQAMDDFGKYYGESADNRRNYLMGKYSDTLNFVKGDEFKGKSFCVGF